MSAPHLSRQAHTARERALFRVCVGLLTAAALLAALAVAALLQARAAASRTLPVVLWEARDGAAHLVENTGVAVDRVAEAQVRGFVRAFLRHYAETSAPTLSRDFAAAQALMSDALRTVAASDGSGEWTRLNHIRLSQLVDTLHAVEVDLPGFDPAAPQVVALARARRERARVERPEQVVTVDYVDVVLRLRRTPVRTDRLWGLEVDSLEMSTFASADALNAARAARSR